METEGAADRLDAVESLPSVLGQLTEDFGMACADVIEEFCLANGGQKRNIWGR
jgi:hypothetical protein